MSIAIWNMCHRVDEGLVLRASRRIQNLKPTRRSVDEGPVLRASRRSSRFWITALQVDEGPTQQGKISRGGSTGPPFLLTENT